MSIHGRRKSDVLLLGSGTLGVAHAVAQSLALGPIISAVVLSYLIVGAAGSVAPFVTLVAFGGSLALGWTVSLYARRYAGAGAIYEYVSCAHGPTLGVLAGLAYVYTSLHGVAVLYVAAGLFSQSFAQAHLGFDPGWWVGAVAAGLLVVPLQYWGMRVSAGVQLALTALSAVPLGVLTVAVLASGGDSGHTFSVFNPANAPAGEAFRGLLFAVGLFVGFETAASLGEEARLPHSSIPRGFLTTIVIAGVFYLGVIYAGTIGFGVERVGREWGTDPVALSKLADREVGSPLGALIELALILDILAVLAAISNAAARILFTLSRDGLLPGVLAVRSRHDTPLGGIVACIGVGLAALVVTIPLTTKFDIITVTAVPTGLIYMLVYGGLAIGAVPFLRAVPGSPWRWALVLTAAAVPMLGIYGTLSPLPEGAARTGVWIALALFCLGAALMSYLRLRRPAAFQRAAAHTLVPADVEQP